MKAITAKSVSTPRHFSCAGVRFCSWQRREMHLPPLAPLSQRTRLARGAEVSRRKGEDAGDEGAGREGGDAGDERRRGNGGDRYLRTEDETVRGARSGPGSLCQQSGDETAATGGGVDVVSGAKAFALLGGLQQAVGRSED